MVNSDTENVIIESGSASELLLNSVRRNGGSVFLHLSGSILNENCIIKFFYADDEGQKPFSTQKLWLCTSGKFLVFVEGYFLRRCGFVGEYSVIGKLLGVDGSEIARLIIPVEGKQGRRYKVT